MNNEIMLHTPEPLLSLVQSCEVYCVAYCCGLDAFDTSKEQVAIWVGSQSREQASLALAQLNALMAMVKPESVVTFWEGFGHDLPAEKCMEWLNAFKVSLEFTLNFKMVQ